MNITEGPGKNSENAADIFFEKQLSIRRVTKDEFVAAMKARNPEALEEDIVVSQGANFNEEGKIVILIRTDMIPQEYLPYVETHEKWEAYIARKEGYNLYLKAKRAFAEDHGETVFTPERREAFFNSLQQMRYEFRHEYAVYKEYEQAQREGKLQEWHAFLEAQDKKTLDSLPENEAMPQIANDLRIRQSIFEKLTEGTKHSFLRAS